ncbi:FKBP prolyl isomerase 16 [Trichomycterus rosablanca]|uniref:FKBP prolyl isomerase 16 n=1 Tax=Trichomycterus rosablanca TaxID=2290929 RepID=UPI002F35731E
MGHRWWEPRSVLPDHNPPNQPSSIFEYVGWCIFGDRLLQGIRCNRNKEGFKTYHWIQKNQQRRITTDSKDNKCLQAQAVTSKSQQQTLEPNLVIGKMEEDKDKVPCNNEAKEDKNYEDKRENNAVDTHHAGGCIGTECKDSINENHTSKNKLSKTPSFGRTVRFSDTKEVVRGDSSEVNLFPDHENKEWTTTTFEELFTSGDWINLTDDCLLRKKVLNVKPTHAPCPIWGHEVTMKMQGILKDRTMVEKDCKLVFVIGEGDVNQALEKCAVTMRMEEVALLLADSQYTYGQLGREPDIPAWAPIMYQLQLLEIKEKLDPLSLPVADRIRIGNQKRERGNFYFLREEYDRAAQAYCMALDVLTTNSQEEQCFTPEEEEVSDYRVKCLNNLGAVQLKLQQYDEALHTSQDVLCLDPNNVKALYRKGKLLSNMGDYEEAMETLKKALKLEPSTKAIHAELSKLVKRQAGDKDILNPVTAEIFRGSTSLLPKARKKNSHGISSVMLLGAMVVALVSLIISLILTARS